MNRKELNSLNEMKSVEQFLTNNQATFADKPGIVAAHNGLKTLIGQAESNYQLQSIDTTVETAIKDDAKKDLTAITLKVAAAMTAVAAGTSNARLRAIADVSKNSLNRMREPDYINKVRSISQEASTMGDELATWEVSLREIDRLGTLLDSFSKTAPINRNIEAANIQATADLRANLSDARALMRDTLDALLLPYKTINPTLYGQYQVARAIINRSATQSGKTEPAKTEE